ncbi:receptor-type tyrosine-protein phosphatase mu isoform X2 [Nematostella vectensis]|uniref:receptor-type tyrosine-protein phosphatase mu isoform X2 n=1 Tax=Nematostella vectensis TaxID=45351 RepID=UPI0020779479|nr:receptor-type tyrosine-protein phosphatase mu isoform X2 [Nematostella vectensis]
MISIECNPKMSGRYIRIVLITAFNALTLCEVEVYTDNSMCGGQAIGISDSHVISDAKLTASSSQSGFPASSGRLLGASAWKPVSLSTDKEPWIMVNLGAKYHVCAVGTQGSPVDGDRSTVYMIDYSLDGRSWTIENIDNTGNRDQNTIIKNPQSMSAMFIRVRPRWRSGHPLFALRMEVYGVIVACTAPFGLENNTIPDGQISSNSSEASHPASQGRLYGASSWCSVMSSSGYLQVDLGSRKTVTGIATQGDHTRDNWVTKYKVLHSHDNKLWMETQSAEFDGNSDRDNVKVNWFTRPVGARYIRVLSTASNGATCMRMELYGCNRYVEVKVAPMSDVVLPASSSGHVDLQCLARGYGMEITFRWTLTESDVTHLSGGARRNNTHAMSSFRYNFTSAEAVFDASNCTLPSSGRDVSCKSRFPYRCIAWYPTLPGGVVDYKEAFVTTTLKLPGKPFAVNSTEVRSRSISLTWSSPVKEDGELMTTSYKIELVTNGTIYTSSSNQSAVTGLKPYTGYRFRVKAVSSRAEGAWSDEAHIVTEQEAPSYSPEDLAVGYSDGKAHNITWNPIPHNQSNGVIVVYEITWVKVANITRSRRALDAVSSANTSSTSYRLTNLLPCSVYNISVRGYTIAGPGPFTRPLSLNTPAPGAAKDVKAVIDSGKVNLSWKKPDLDVLGFKIYYSGSKSYDPSFNHQETQGPVSRTATTREISGLVPGTRYEFKIRTLTLCGEEEFSNTTVVDTEIENPKAPNVSEPATVNGSSSGKANITLWPVKQTNGPISFYQVIVADRTDGIPVANFSELDKNQEESPDLYISAQIDYAAVGASGFAFTLGNGKLYGGFTNGKLEGGKTYEVFQRAVTKTDKKLYIGKEALIATVSTKVSTKSSQSPVEEKGGPGGEVAAYVLVPLFVIILIIVAIFLMRRRKRPLKNNNKTKSREPLDVGLSDMNHSDVDSSLNNEISTDAPISTTPAQPSDDSLIYSEPITETKPGPIPKHQFPEYFKRVSQNNYATLHHEFDNLANTKQSSINVAKKPENKIKNRYGNIVAYDHTRVVLKGPGGNRDGRSDYINASYLQGFDGTPKKYIAAQGPVEPSCDDFWQMVWQEKCSVIVMLTGLIEGSKEKCHKYWPDTNQPKPYGQYTVSLCKNEAFADYTVRTFLVTSAPTNEQRFIYQYHFTVWPDKGVPQYATAVLRFRKKIINESRHNTAHWIVHCSAGVGRTGAFIVIDAMLRQAKEKKVVDIYNYVRATRGDRPHMVQTKDQYVFIHRAVLEALVCGSTDIQAPNLRNVMTKLEKIRPREQVSGYESEFQRLSIFWLSPDVRVESASRACNASKNRFPDILPLDSHRVALHLSVDKDPGADYINASFAHAYRERNAFILTQAPLEDTIASFWRMVVDYDLGTIVMLNSLDEEDEHFPQYWPSQGAEEYGGIKVELQEEDDKSFFISRRFDITTKGKSTPQRICHFQVTNWSDHSVPDKPLDLLPLLNDIQTSQQKSGDKSIVVQCSDGVGRSGTLCAIMSVIERVKVEHVVDVFQAVKNLRISRPGAVETLEQYKFCYDVTLAYLDSFSTYGNFSDC